MLFTWIALGGVIATVVIFGFAIITANKDDKKFTANGPMFNQESQRIFNREGSDGMWFKQSTTVIYGEPNKPKKPKKKSKALSLKEKLDRALAEEKYEEAAKIRDQINKQK